MSKRKAGDQVKDDEVTKTESPQQRRTQQRMTKLEAKIADTADPCIVFQVLGDCGELSRFLIHLKQIPMNMKEGEWDPPMTRKVLEWMVENVGVTDSDDVKRKNGSAQFLESCNEWERIPMSCPVYVQHIVFGMLDELPHQRVVFIHLHREL